METITYEYEGALYVNLTNRCDCACVFCLRCNGHKGSIYADDLWLEHEPGREEALADFLRRDLASYREIVFCGFGEPMYRTDDILWLVDELKERVSALPPVRINTNGHANLILGRDVTGDLAGRIDVLSISLNGSTPGEYVAVTRPRDGAAAPGPCRIRVRLPCSTDCFNRYPVLCCLRPLLGRRGISEWNLQL